jgi:uncharacterized protein (TIGR03083 family)
MLTAEAYQAALERDATAFVSLVATADATRAVPWCPGWTVDDLARHLGSVHRWAREIVRTREPAQEPSAPSGHDALVAWLSDGAAGLVAELRDTDPATPLWTFGPRPRTAMFWSRRQAHETAVHLADLRHALELPITMDADLAADGVDEVVHMFFPRQVRLERIAPLARGIAIELTTGQRFVLAGDGIEPGGDVAAVVRATPQQAMLMLWGRGGFDDAQVDGDAGAVRDVLRAGITP